MAPTSAIVDLAIHLEAGISGKQREKMKRGFRTIIDPFAPTDQVKKLKKSIMETGKWQWHQSKQNCPPAYHCTNIAEVLARRISTMAEHGFILII